MKRILDSAKENMPTVPKSAQLFKCESCQEFKRLTEKHKCGRCQKCCTCKDATP